MKHVKLISPMIIALAIVSCGSNPTPTPTPAEKYTVTWVNYNDAVLEVDKDVTKGTMPSYDGATPTCEPTAEYTFEFIGWLPALAPVTADVTYKARYEMHEIKESLDINIKNNGEFTGDFSSEKNRNAFITWANGKDCDLITSVSVAEGCYAQVNEVFSGLTTLILGSGKKQGDFTINFKYPVIAVNLDCQGYYNQWTVQGQTHFSADTEATLQIGDKIDINLKSDGTTVPVEKNCYYRLDELYKEPVTSITFKSSASPGRVFIHKLGFEYKMK